MVNKENGVLWFAILISDGYKIPVVLGTIMYKLHDDVIK